MQIAGYIRVSRQEQQDKGHSLESQEFRLKKEGAELIYVDVDSGRWNRKNLDRLMDDARAGKVAKILVTEVTRFGRSLIDIKRNIHELIELGVKFESISERFDPETSHGMLWLNQLASLAEFESKRISERVSHGWEYLRLNQKAINPPFGYRVEEDRYVLDTRPFVCTLCDRKTLSKSEIAKQIIEFYFEQKSLRLTVRRINETFGIFQPAFYKRGGHFKRQALSFHPSALQEWLLNPVLRGHTCYLKKKGSWFSRKKKRLPSSDWIIYPDTHLTERLLTEEQLLEMKQIMADNKQRSGFCKPVVEYPLSGLVCCAECQATHYSIKSGRGKTPGYNYYYQCSRWRQRGCSQKNMIRMSVVENALIEVLTGKADEIAKLAMSDRPKTDPPELKRLKTELATLMAIASNNPSIESAIEYTRLQIQQFEHNEQSQVESRSSNYEMLISVFSDPIYFKSLTPEGQRRAFHALVEKVLVRDGQIVEIRLKV